MASLLEALEGGPLVVDGAMGSQLFERGILHNACLEELCVSKPDVIRKVHEDYVRAGAQVLETNSFGANAMRLEKYGLATKVKELNEAAVKVAREAAGAKAFVVGALGPSGYFLGEALPDDLAKVRAALHEQATRARRLGRRRDPRRDVPADERAPRSRSRARSPRPAARSPSSHPRPSTSGAAWPTGRARRRSRG